jgi:hypothetical protein
MQVFVAAAGNFNEHAHATHPAATVNHWDRVDIALRVDQDALRLGRDSADCRLTASSSRSVTAPPDWQHRREQTGRTADETGGGKRCAKNVSRCSRDARLDDHAKYGIGHHATPTASDTTDPTMAPMTMPAITRHFLSWRTTLAYMRSTSS